MKSAGNMSGRRVFGPPTQGRSSRDEDLVLFRELHKREKERLASLLLPVSEEFEPTGTNNHHALFRIPSHNKMSSQGLESLSETEKNDYDWLKTPPATPLFTSLEMEATGAPEMVIHRELPIIHPLSRFSSSGLHGPKTGQELTSTPKTKTPSTNKPKPSPTPAVTNNPTTKARPKSSTSRTTPHPHQDPFLASNLSKPEAKLKAESTSSRPKSRGSVSPSVRAMIKDVSDKTPENLKTDKRSLSSTRGRAISSKAVEVVTPPNVKTEQRSVSSTRVRAAVTTPLKQKPGTSNPRRDSTSPSVNRGRTPDAIFKTRKEDVEGASGVVRSGSGTTTQFFGSKMVDKVMSARKNGGNNDAAVKTVARTAVRDGSVGSVSRVGGGAGFGKVVMTRSPMVDSAVKPQTETKAEQIIRRSSKTTPKATSTSSR